MLASCLDVTGDSHLDLSQPGIASLLIRPGDGAGGFAPVMSVFLGPFIIACAFGDLNADGATDVAGIHPGGLFSSLGQGAGAFAPAVAAPTVAVPVVRVAIADVNLDGTLDAIAWHPDLATNMKNVVTWPGNGNGTFGAGVAARLPGVPSQIVATDIDEDGKPDLMVAFDGGTGLPLTWIPGTGVVGVFGAPVATDATSAPFALGDLDHDGHVDALVAATNAIEVVRGLGGTFAPKTSQAAATGTGSLAVPALVDLDGDGRLDAVISSVSGSTLSTLMNAMPLTTGIASFGDGTPGCRGILGVHANSTPTVGNASYALTCTNAPPSSLLLVIKTDVADVVGSDSLGIGLKLHVDLFSSSFVLGFDAFSDVSGAGTQHSPIPNLPSLSGAVIHLQFFAIGTSGAGEACSSAAIGLVSSRGLTETVQ